MCLFQQALRFDAPFIQTDNFKGASSADSNQIGRDTLVGGVSYLVAENVGFEEIEYAVFGFQFDFFGRQAFLCFHIAIYFVVETAFQFGALSGKLLRIQ